LNLLRESGNPGLPLSVNFSCGLLPTTDAGLRTDWLRGGYLIQIIVAFVIKKWKIFSTFSWDVSSLETFGSPSCRALALLHLLLNLLTNPLITGGEKLMVRSVEIIIWV